MLHSQNLQCFHYPTSGWYSRRLRAPNGKIRKIFNKRQSYLFYLGHLQRKLQLHTLEDGGLPVWRTSGPLKTVDRDILNIEQSNQALRKVINTSKQTSLPQKQPHLQRHHHPSPHLKRIIYNRIRYLRAFSLRSHRRRRRRTPQHPHLCQETLLFLGEASREKKGKTFEDLRKPILAVPKADQKEPQGQRFGKHNEKKGREEFRLVDSDQLWACKQQQNWGINVNAHGHRKRVIFFQQ